MERDYSHRSKECASRIVLLSEKCSKLRGIRLLEVSFCEEKPHGLGSLRIKEIVRDQ